LAENVPPAELGHTRKASYDPESHALLAPAHDREYVWNAQGQLIAIRQENRELARYRYNHHGLRISKQTHQPKGVSFAAQRGQLELTDRDPISRRYFASLKA
jgi:YD repeat-containing protein